MPLLSGLLAFWDFSTTLLKHAHPEMISCSSGHCPYPFYFLTLFFYWENFPAYSRPSSPPGSSGHTDSTLSQARAKCPGLSLVMSDRAVSKLRDHESF